MNVWESKSTWVRCIWIFASTSPLVYFAYATWFTFRYWARAIGYAGALDYGEGVVLQEINVILGGGPVYSGALINEFRASNYGPLFYWISAAITSLAPGTYGPGRFLSLLGVLISALSFGLLAWKKTGQKSAGILGAMLTLVPITVLLFGITNKPDSLALGISQAGLALALSRLEGRRVFFSALLFASAGLIKQSVLVAPATVFIALLLSNPKRAIQFGLACAVAFACLILACTPFLGFKEFVSHYLFYNVAELDWHRAFVESPVAFFVFYKWHLLVAAICTYIARERILVLYFVIGIVFHLIVSAKAGAFLNYFSEPAIALNLIVAVAFGKAIRDRATLTWRAAAILISIGFLALTTKPKGYKEPPTATSIKNDSEAMSALRTLTEQPERPTAFAAYPDLLPRLQGKVQILVDDPFLYNQHVKKGLIEDFVLKNIQERRVDIVIVHFNPADTSNVHRWILERMTESQCSALVQNYKLWKVLPGTDYTQGDFWIYVPNRITRQR